MMIRELQGMETEQAIALALNGFMRFEAQEYGPEGTFTFQQTLRDPAYLSEVRWYGAFIGELMVGMIATRKQGSHITLFFVDEDYHRQGIGRRLFEAALSDTAGPMITVNASPYAVAVYRKLGFVSVKGEQVTDGIRYTPMRYDIHRHGMTLSGSPAGQM